MSGNHQSSGGQQSLGTLNPIGAALGNLFGIGTKQARGGGLTTAGFDKGNFILPQVFGPDTFSNLGDITSTLNPMTLDLGQLGQGASGALGTLSDAASTGLIGPAQDLFNQMFKEKISGLQEQFGGLGINPNDTDFQAAALREAQLGSTQLADLAQNRRLQASQLFPQAGGDLLSLEGAARGAERMRTPGGQQFDLLTTLAGINPQSGGIGINAGGGSGWNWKG